MSSGSITEHIPLADLVKLFLDEASSALQPWVLSQGGECRASLTHANAEGTFEETTPDALHGFFLANVEFRTGTLIGEISYGDRELFINTVVSPLGRPLRHGLWEWADAVGEREIPPRDTDFVLQPDRLRSIVRGMAQALTKLAVVIAVADADVVERMDAAREIVRVKQQARWRLAEHDGTVRRAEEAFRDQDWARVVELLSSVSDLLSPAEKAKLQYAAARLR